MCFNVFVIVCISHLGHLENILISNDDDTTILDVDVSPPSSRESRSSNQTVILRSDYRHNSSSVLSSAQISPSASPPLPSAPIFVPHQPPAPSPTPRPAFVDGQIIQLSDYSNDDNHPPDEKSDQRVSLHSNNNQDVNDKELMSENQDRGHQNEQSGMEDCDGDRYASIITIYCLPNLMIIGTFLPKIKT